MKTSVDRIAAQTDPVHRMVQVVKWYLSGWHYKTTGVKKPFNPIIGETFATYWQHADGSRTHYLAEQVLHRPPMTAMYVENRKHGFVCTSAIHTKSKFVAPQTAQSILDGAALLHILPYDEVYFITFPTYNAHGLLMGTLRTEVGGEAFIVCEKSGLRANLTFHQLPFFGGSHQHNRVETHIMRGDTEVAVVDGHWDADLTIRYAGKRTEEVLLDVRTEPVAAKYVLPEDRQNPWESRRLWGPTCRALLERPTVDWDEVTRRKAILEEGQRDLPCHQKGEDFKPWPTKFFHPKPVRDPIKGKTIDMFVFDHMRTTKYVEGEPELNTIALSQRFVDSRSAPEEVPKSPGDEAAAAAAAGGSSS